MIGDDGSDDGSWELICEKYDHEEHIRLFRQKREQGIYEYSTLRHARLIVRLMKEVRGEFFSIMDGDDYYCDKTCFQRKINILEKGENQDCILCVSNFKMVYEDGRESCH